MCILFSFGFSQSKKEKSSKPAYMALMLSLLKIFTLGNGHATRLGSCGARAQSVKYVAFLELQPTLRFNILFAFPPLIFEMIILQTLQVALFVREMKSRFGLLLPLHHDAWCMFPAASTQSPMSDTEFDIRMREFLVSIDKRNKKNLPERYDYDGSGNLEVVLNWNPFSIPIPINIMDWRKSYHWIS